MTKIIALDAGHGLKTAGKQTLKGDKGIIKEWTLNDKVRDYVVENLKDYDCEFIFPDNNEGNTDESLADRWNKYMSGNIKADVMVSIHHNAYTGKWNNATGVEVFTDRNYTKEDQRLAECIYKNFPKYTGLRGRGIKRENWAVINQNKIPAVLCESGFMDSTIDYPVITSEAGQKGYARAVAEGLIEFLDLKKKEPVVETYKGYVEIIYGGSDGLDLHSKPVFNGNVAKVAKQGEVFEVVGRVKVSGTYMYKLTNGYYVTSATKYVKYTTTNPKPATTNTIKAGYKVKIKSGATKYANSTKSIPLWVKLKTYTVKEVKDAKALLKEITSWVYVKDLNVVKTTETNTAIKVGDMVGVKSGAKDYNGNKAGGVKRGVVCYRVDELKGKRAVLDKDGICTPFHVDNLFK